MKPVTHGDLAAAVMTAAMLGALLSLLIWGSDIAALKKEIGKLRGDLITAKAEAIGIKSRK